MPGPVRACAMTWVGLLSVMHVQGQGASHPEAPNPPLTREDSKGRLHLINDAGVDHAHCQQGTGHHVFVCAWGGETAMRGGGLG
jgi:hypothetical protein